MTDPDPTPRAAGHLERAGPLARSLDGIAWVYGVALLILALAVARLWLMPPNHPEPPSAAVVTLAREVSELQARVAQLESRPQPAAADLQSLAARVAALEGRSAAPEPAAATSTGNDAQPAGSVGELAQRETALAAQLRDEQRRLALIARVQAAGAALADGRPLGDWPDAPPALARFTKAPPPTEATLRLTFEAAAQAALAASRPAPPADASLWRRALDRVEGLVTVREGDQVLLGDPAAGIVAHARHALEAGDLAGAVEALQGLPPTAAAAFAGWISQARALLDARAALAGLAAGN